MAAPLTMLLVVAVTIRAVLFRSSLDDIISERVEVVSPLNTWKRGNLVECLALLDMGVSPYAGNVFHETPLIIYFFHFVNAYTEIVFMVSGLHALCDRSLLLCECFSLCLFPSLSMPDLTPNIGALIGCPCKYLEIERYRRHTCHECRLPNSTSPISDFCTRRLGETSTRKIFGFRLIKNDMTVHYINIFLVLVVLLACSALFPVLWHLWIYAGSANSNFYYSITLLFNVAQILVVSDYFYVYLRREHHLTHGQYLKRKDGSEATLVLK
uniref:Phosphatidylinositol glycan anchor biosynthesis, class U n=1 Tax=Oncorhynchus tshawytscha TaxID=74940 RepID=A0AAZ3RP76_ONCTS